MGYFSNGTEAEMYAERYCARCMHGPRRNPDEGCAVWLLHMLHNYEECDKPDSFLNLLIPRAQGDVGNEQCAMFREDQDLPDPRQQAMDL
jgi:hypothetical protein